jgi:hypothetical protein
MADDDRDVLEVLRFELGFLEQGGYGRSVRTPWKGTSIFQDSLSCLNFDQPERPHPCDECLLMKFVPQEARGEEVPCHHIPLTAQGETLESLDRGSNQQELEEVMIGWLKKTIQRMEQERAGQASAARG